MINKKVKSFSYCTVSFLQQYHTQQFDRITWDSYEYAKAMSGYARNTVGFVMCRKSINSKLLKELLS